MNRLSPQLVVTIALIALFAFAFFKNTDDEMFKGALIAAFSAAYGYWLGSSSGSKQNGDVVRQIASQPSITATGDNPTINSPGPVEAPAEPLSEADDFDPTRFGGPRS